MITKSLAVTLLMGVNVVFSELDTAVSLVQVRADKSTNGGGLQTNKSSSAVTPTLTQTGFEEVIQSENRTQDLKKFVARLLDMDGKMVVSEENLHNFVESDKGTEGSNFKQWQTNLLTQPWVVNKPREMLTLLAESSNITRGQKINTTGSANITHEQKVNETARLNVAQKQKNNATERTNTTQVLMVNVTEGSNLIHAEKATTAVSDLWHDTGGNIDGASRDYAMQTEKTAVSEKAKTAVLENVVGWASEEMGKVENEATHAFSRLTGFFKRAKAVEAKPVPVEVQHRADKPVDADNPEKLARRIKTLHILPTDLLETGRVNHANASDGIAFIEKAEGTLKKVAVIEIATP